MKIAIFNGMAIGKTHGHFLASISFVLIFINPSVWGATIIPSGVLTNTLTSAQHPLADKINAFLKNQIPSKGDFSPTGFARTDYLKVIESLVRAMLKYQNSSGQIIDPVRKREFQYATPCFAHAVSVLCGSGFSKDQDLLSAGTKAMEASIKHMLNDDVPDGHGDFFTVPLMLAYQNFKNAVPAAQSTKWRTDLGKINPSVVYGNSAPNWIGINMTGEFFRYLEGLTDISYVENRILYQITRMGKDGLYQDSDKPETLTVANTDGNSFAYDNVARSFLSMVAHNGYKGKYAEELHVRLWKGAWTGLLYQSPFGEVPTGNRSSQHFWNEAAAALNYELWAAQYAQAGKAAEAGAFKRAAMLSLTTVKSWLRPDGSGYVTKARYPIEDQWGYMAYSSHTQYNMWCASALAAAWQFGDSTVKEMPAPSDIGGFVAPVLLGFKKIFANAGGTYVEFDVRGDHAHNATGLLRVHVKGSFPQLGPSDGAVGQVDPNAQYQPLYPDADPAGLLNLSIGPGWTDANSDWYPLAEVQKIPDVKILEETPSMSSFKVIYPVSGSEKLIETVIVEPSGVTVIDTMSGGSRTGLRVYYPMLTTDGEEKTKIELSGSQLTLHLKNRGLRFSIRKPESAVITRTNTERNHRNGKCERVYADIKGAMAEYRVTAWPEYIPTMVSGALCRANDHQSLGQVYFRGTKLHVPEVLSGSFRAFIYSLRGELVTEMNGVLLEGMADLQKVNLPRAAGVFRMVLFCNGGSLHTVYMRMK